MELTNYKETDFVEEAKRIESPKEKTHTKKSVSFNIVNSGNISIINSSASINTSIINVNKLEDYYEEPDIEDTWDDLDDFVETKITEKRKLDIDAFDMDKIAEILEEDDLENIRKEDGALIPEELNDLDLALSLAIEDSQAFETPDKWDKIADGLVFANGVIPEKNENSKQEIEYGGPRPTLQLSKNQQKKIAKYEAKQKTKELNKIMANARKTAENLVRQNNKRTLNNTIANTESIILVLKEAKEYQDNMFSSIDNPEIHKMHSIRFKDRMTYVYNRIKELQSLAASLI